MATAQPPNVPPAPKPRKPGAPAAPAPRASNSVRTVRTIAAASTTPEEFFHLLADSGVQVEILRFPSGDIRGYKVALNGDTNGAGEPVWFSGSTLAPDLSYPQIRSRLTSTEPAPPGPRRPNPWHQVTAATERIPHHLDQIDDPASQAHIAALAETLDILPFIAPNDIRPQLQQAAAAFERASRSRIHADHQHARALRNAVRTMARQPTTADSAGITMLLDAAVLAVIAIRHWHAARHHNQQVQAAHQTLVHLQAAYEQAAAAPLAALTSRTPTQSTLARHARQLRITVPDHAEQIVADPAWPALATTLTDAAAAGHDPARLLRQAADQRALTDARSPAQVLVWRIHRLIDKPAGTVNPAAPINATAPQIASRQRRR